jgi:hypothetical protein
MLLAGNSVLNCGTPTNQLRRVAVFDLGVPAQQR